MKVRLFHIFPTFDGQDHVRSGPSCPCEPERQEIEEDGRRVVLLIHKPAN